MADRKKILAIGAHYDDVELGCGGSLARWAAEGCDISVFVGTRSGYSDPGGRVVRPDDVALEEGRRAAALLGAKLIPGELPTFEVEFDERLNARLTTVLAELVPDLVLTHWGSDTHHDHRAIARATLHCARRVPRILAYRSNWHDSDVPFSPRFYVDITGHLARKIELIATFESEHGRTGGRWTEWVEAQAANYGFAAGCTHAEAFELLRWRE